MDKNALRAVLFAALAVASQGRPRTFVRHPLRPRLRLRSDLPASDRVSNFGRRAEVSSEDMALPRHLVLRAGQRQLKFEGCDGSAPLALPTALSGRLP